ncbi:hypothetical protein TYRP_006334 [Tyrophagus putrescentiae]|nr:hypothetical protein TYRP_006334 [Tyrophagus putrescentiae]
MCDVMIRDTVSSTSDKQPKIGPDHQAEIPDILTEEQKNLYKTNRQEMADPQWKPTSNIDDLTLTRFVQCFEEECGARSRIIYKTEKDKCRDHEKALERLYVNEYDIIKALDSLVGQSWALGLGLDHRPQFGLLLLGEHKDELGVGVGGLLQQLAHLQPVAVAFGAGGDVGDGQLEVAQVELRDGLLLRLPNTTGTLLLLQKGLLLFFSVIALHHQIGQIELTTHLGPHGELRQLVLHFGGGGEGGGGPSEELGDARLLLSVEGGNGRLRLFGQRAEAHRRPQLVHLQVEASEEAEGGGEGGGGTVGERAQTVFRRLQRRQDGHRQVQALPLDKLGYFSSSSSSFVSSRGSAQRSSAEHLRLIGQTGPGLRQLGHRRGHLLRARLSVAVQTAGVPVGADQRSLVGAAEAAPAEKVVVLLQRLLAILKGRRLGLAVGDVQLFAGGNVPTGLEDDVPRRPAPLDVGGAAVIDQRADKDLPGGDVALLRAAVVELAEDIDGDATDLFEGQLKDQGAIAQQKNQRSVQRLEGVPGGPAGAVRLRVHRQRGGHAKEQAAVGRIGKGVQVAGGAQRHRLEARLGDDAVGVDAGQRSSLEEEAQEAALVTVVGVVGLFGAVRAAVAHLGAEVAGQTEAHVLLFQAVVAGGGEEVLVHHTTVRLLHQQPGAGHDGRGGHKVTSLVGGLFDFNAGQVGLVAKEGLASGPQAGQAAHRQDLHLLDAAGGNLRQRRTRSREGVVLLKRFSGGQRHPGVHGGGSKEAQAKSNRRSLRVQAELERQQAVHLAVDDLLGGVGRLKEGLREVALRLTQVVAHLRGFDFGRGARRGLGRPLGERLQRLSGRLPVLLCLRVGLAIDLLVPGGQATLHRLQLQEEPGVSGLAGAFVFFSHQTRTVIVLDENVLELGANHAGGPLLFFSLVLQVVGVVAVVQGGKVGVGVQQLENVVALRGIHRGLFRVKTCFQENFSSNSNRSAGSMSFTGELLKGFLWLKSSGSELVLVFGHPS